MTEMRPHFPALDQLRAAGLRPTRQRLALARLLFNGADRHVTAEVLHSEAEASRVRVSLATVYNTLHQFTAAGLLREVVVDSGRSYFDTNTTEHYHIYHEDTGVLRDVSVGHLSVSGVPALPAGTRLERVDVVIRVRSSESLS